MLIAMIQACYNPLLQSSTEQWAKHFALHSSAVHWCWLTAALFHCKYTCGDLHFILVCNGAKPEQCNTGQGKILPHSRHRRQSVVKETVQAAERTRFAVCKLTLLGGILLPRYDLVYTRFDARISVLKLLHFILSESGHQKRTASVGISLRAQAREGVPQRFLDGCARVVGVKHQFCEIWLRNCVQKRFFSAPAQD